MTLSIAKTLAAFAAAAFLSTAALPAQTPAAPGAVDYRVAARSPGVWSYRPVAGGSEALFMDATAVVRLTFRCTRQNRTVTISRPSAAPVSALFVWTSSLARNLPARFEPNLMRASADVHASDRLLDAIAFSRGRIAFSMPGVAPLVVDSAPEPARVFEDCRN